MDIDHYHEAQEALATAADGFQYLKDRNEAPALYAQLAIGHALVRVAEALDRIGDDLDELKRRDKFK